MSERVTEMVAGYRAGLPRGVRGLIRAFAGLGGDRRPPSAHRALAAVVAAAGERGICLSVGGGPLRVHPRMTNLNIGLFPEVDLVGTAYALPFGDGMVASVHCEAVLEHLEYPNEAAREMFRVLRPRGLVFAATPFLQSYHGYPGHFQNFTLEGHRRLFERAGFEVVEAGLCVGPAFALVDLLANSARATFTSHRLAGAAAATVGLLGVLLRPADRWMNRRPNAHRVASSTYLLARKPEQRESEVVEPQSARFRLPDEVGVSR